MTEDQKPLDLHHLANSGGFGSARLRMEEAGAYKKTKKAISWKARYMHLKGKLLDFMSEQDIEAWMDTIDKEENQ